MTNLPPPQQWVIKRMSQAEVAEMIERHIDFVDKEVAPSTCQTKFVRHYMKRDDGELPTLRRRFDAPARTRRRLSSWPRISLTGYAASISVSRTMSRSTVPKPGSVTDDDVEQAMQFLTDEWLVDVATDYAGKCTIIAAALTIIERSLLDQRPAFFVTAGRRGGGKTTTLTMLIKAVTGIWPAAAAWSTNEEERRKALLSYFLYGVAIHLVGQHRTRHADQLPAYREELHGRVLFGSKAGCQ